MKKLLFVILLFVAFQAHAQDTTKILDSVQFPIVTYYGTFNGQDSGLTISTTDDSLLVYLYLAPDSNGVPTGYLNLSFIGADWQRTDTTMRAAWQMKLTLSGNDSSQYKVNPIVYGKLVNPYDLNQDGHIGVSDLFAVLKKLFKL